MTKKNFSTKRKILSGKQSDLISEEIQAIKEMLLSQQEEFVQYKETSEKKVKALIEENTELKIELNEIKDKNSKMEIEISRLNENLGRLENEKKINEDFIEEKKENRDRDKKENDYINIIKHLQKQLEESKRKNQEMNEKQNKESKNERSLYVKIINELKEKNINLEKEISITKEDLNKKEMKEKLIKEEEENKNSWKEFESNKINYEYKTKEKDKELNKINYKSKDDNNNYIKKIRDLSEQLNTANRELNYLKSKNNIISKLLDGQRSLIKDKLDEYKKVIEKLKEVINYYKKKMEEDDSKVKLFKEVEVKNKFLSDSKKALEKNIEELKAQKKKAEEEFREEMNKVESELGQMKCQYVDQAYEYELIIAKLKKYIDKLKSKLIKMGIKFKSKKENEFNQKEELYDIN